MATFTATEIKALTSIAQVSTWADVKCERYVSMAETWINKYEMDTSVSGYSTAYENAVILAFDYLAENPTGRTGFTMGKRKTEHQGDADRMIKNVIENFISSDTFKGAEIERTDIGLH